MSKHLLSSFIIFLFLAAAIFSSANSAHAEDMTCPEHTPVQVDIKPGSYPNTINLSSNGVLPVAVLTTPDFDASLFSPEMAHLSDAATDMSAGCAGAMAVRWNFDDVNGDGMEDIVFFFQVRELNLTPGSTAATLMAHGFYNSAEIHIMGTDSVIVKPGKN